MVKTLHLHVRSMVVDARLSLKQWQSHGLDIHTIVETAPDIQTIIQWGRDMLQHAT